LLRIWRQGNRKERSCDAAGGQIEQVKEVRVWSPGPKTGNQQQGIVKSMSAKVKLQARSMHLIFSEVFPAPVMDASGDIRNEEAAIGCDTSLHRSHELPRPVTPTAELFQHGPFGAVYAHLAFHNVGQDEVSAGRNGPQGPGVDHGIQLLKLDLSYHLNTGRQGKVRLRCPLAVFDRPLPTAR
jgi:hypothetical protein